MATYAIGDVHGCYQTLLRLLDRLEFDEARDSLWLTGDLVNRGAGSLAVLRWARAAAETLGDRFVTVLGNHDLHAVAVANGWSKSRRKDTLEELLEADDARSLLLWLSRRPLLYRHSKYVLVHAGVLPEWTIEDAQELATKVARALSDSVQAPQLVLRPGAGAETSNYLWRALAALTRLRTLTPDGDFCNFTGPPEATPVGCVPWFEHPSRRSRGEIFVVGHWAALGLRVERGLIALDSGCTYGGSLSAVRLEDGAVFQQQNVDP